ncbi:MAG TPA: N-acetylgalactosamine-6-sulfatase [Verrucomicrobiales bacterium]|nr:N-acetylgalactosamine-6-sulfatase [Verrucomicrobiales bacterium]
MKTNRIGTLLALLVCAGTIASSAAEKKPNFVIIYADDLGYGDLGCFGNTTIKTPNIDRMAAEGMKLTSFYAQTVCGPSRTSLMTGCYPMRVATHQNSVGNHPVVDSTEITVAEVLKDVGYKTIAIGKWSLARQTQKRSAIVTHLLPTHQGFDSFFGTGGSNDSIVNLIRGEKVIEKRVNMGQLSRRYTDEAIGFIKENNGEPFLLYLAHTMAHVKLAVSDEFKGKSTGGLYGDVIEEMDFHVGRILKTIKEEGLDENTYVIFTSDNGPWYLGRSAGHIKRYGENAADHGGTAFPLRGDKTNGWEGGLRVPCVVRAPGRVPPGTEDDTIAGLIDILPTFASLAGGEVPTDRVIDGIDISSIWAKDKFIDSNKFASRPYFYYIRTRLQAVRLGKWKLHVPRPVDRVWGHYSREGDYGAVTEPLLFDLEAEIGEKTNVAAKHPEVVAELTRLIEKARADIGDHDRKGANARFLKGFPERPDLNPKLQKPRSKPGAGNKPKKNK